MRAPKPRKTLQKSLRPEPRYWIYNRHCLPPENPAGHRKANRRVTKVHYSHKHPPSGLLAHLRGDIHELYRHNSNASANEQGTTVP